ncbi:hypothetical protein DFH06DRAFT_1122298 [Mycena polygramma]|nr:hypothetical protein DFH06DRAFT_1122298 [Mycena polygramma]
MTRTTDSEIKTNILQSRDRHDRARETVQSKTRRRALLKQKGARNEPEAYPDCVQIRINLMMWSEASRVVWLGLRVLWLRGRCQAVPVLDIKPLLRVGSMGLIIGGGIFWAARKGENSWVMASLTAALGSVSVRLLRRNARWNRAANPQLPISTTLHFDAIIKFSPKKSRSKQDSCSMVKTIPMGLSFFTEYNILPLNRWHCEEKSEHVSFGLILARLPVSCRTTVFSGQISMMASNYQVMDMSNCGFAARFQRALRQRNRTKTEPRAGVLPKTAENRKKTAHALSSAKSYGAFSCRLGFGQSVFPLATNSSLARHCLLLLGSIRDAELYYRSTAWYLAALPLTSTVPMPFKPKEIGGRALKAQCRKVSMRTSQGPDAYEEAGSFKCVEYRRCGRMGADNARESQWGIAHLSLHYLRVSSLVRECVATPHVSLGGNTAEVIEGWRPIAQRRRSPEGNP